MGMTKTRAGARPLYGPAGYRRGLYAVRASLGLTDGEMDIVVSRATGGVPVPVCSMYQPDECMQAIDNKGPYLTEKACEQRIATMVEDTRLLFPYLIQKGYRCEYNSGEST
jgi:hypothetical protein